MTSKKYEILDMQSLNNIKIACLTLDLEQDYGELVEPPIYDGFKHIPEVIAFCKEENIPLTCFIQGLALEKQLDGIGLLNDLDIEFELHAYTHPGNSINTAWQVEKGQEAYYKHFRKTAIGYRSPLGIFKDNDYQVLVNNGIKYDSSIFPTYRIGVFNNLNKPITPYLHRATNIVEFPFSVVSNIIRIPISLSYVKLIGSEYSHILKLCKLPKLVIINFHLHDLYKLVSLQQIQFSKYPLVYRRIYNQIHKAQDNGFNILKDIIHILKYKGYIFSKLIDVYQAIAKK